VHLLYNKRHGNAVFKYSVIYRGKESGKKNVGLRFLSILILMALLIGNVQSFNVAAAEGVIVNGTQFKDTSGNVIHAHGEAC